MNDPNIKHDPIEQVLIEHADCDVPPEIAARARRHLDALRERMDNAESRVKTMKNGIGFHWRRLLALATPVAALAIAAVIFWGPLTNHGNSAYATAVRRIKEAQTMLVSMSIQIQGMPETKMEMAVNKNGCMRMDMGKGIYSIVDSTIMKSATFDTNNKMVFEANLKNLPTEKKADATKYIEHLRSLPDRASERLGMKNLNGKIVEGYRVKEDQKVSEVWIDAGSREVVQVESSTPQMAEVRVTMNNFRFDPPLAPDYFSTATPAGYKVQVLNMDLGNPSAEDFIALMRAMKEISQDGTFPPSLTPGEMTAWVQKNTMATAFKKGYEAAKSAKPPLHIKKQEKPQTPEELAKMAEEMKKDLQRQDKKVEQIRAKMAEAPKPGEMRKQDLEEATRAAKGMMFIMSMKPENDWHYEGKGVKIGDGNTPLAWWKPTGSTNYKIILGDLTTKELPAAEMPKIAAASGAAKAK